MIAKVIYKVKIVYLGDIVAKCGREAVIEAIPQLKQKYHFDALIVNVDNAAHGFGCTAKIAQNLLKSGVSAMVCGDHVWDQKELLTFLDECPRIVRPINYSDNLAGCGAKVIPLDNGKKLLVAEAVGRVFMENVDCPLTKIEDLLKKYRLKHEVDAIFIDIHAEATAEKQAFARYFDGRVSAVIGSHTHVPTADAVILPQGTAYQSDAGMCGNYNGVIGFDETAPIERLKNKSSSTRLEPMGGKATICGTYIETDDTTGLASKIEIIKY